VTTKCPKCLYENPSDTNYCGRCATQIRPFEGATLSKTVTTGARATLPGRERVIAGKYTIISELGKGGMGVVYKAEDTKLERKVALKFLPPELSEDPEARERFVREAKAAAALSHSHICTVYEIGEEENRLFIAMECIEGESLRQKILRGPLPQAEALDIAIQVAEGLAEAHNNKIIHRDIKPGNIMLTEKGAAKVMDFGLAKALGMSLITKEAKTMGPRGGRSIIARTSGLWASSSTKCSQARIPSRANTINPSSIPY
jgi:serine/threonine protein kinase